MHQKYLVIVINLKRMKCISETYPRFIHKNDTEKKNVFWILDYIMMILFKVISLAFNKLDPKCDECYGKLSTLS